MNPLLLWENQGISGGLHFLHPSKGSGQVGLVQAKQLGMGSSEGTECHPWDDFVRDLGVGV